MAESEEFIRTELEGGVGRITLNRPAALHALNLPMVERLGEVLEAWREEPLSAVVIDSSGSKAFCAGGDIRAIQQNTLNGKQECNKSFFATEYKLNYTLATYSRPLVSLIDGICMGGGLGVSVHGHFRVATEATQLAMPETSIGFFPDVGASFFLSRLPGSLGMYLGLTGTRIGPADALYTGLATHLTSSRDIDGIVPALRNRGSKSVDMVLRSFCKPNPVSSSELAKRRSAIDWCFGAPSLALILNRLEQHGEVWSAEQHEVLKKACPQSLQVTFDLISQARELDLAACLEAELTAACYITKTPDFIEGVRAALVDKDRRPKWSTSLDDQKLAIFLNAADSGG
ncbi:enoyl-CoA hydratase/isomerase family protein [Saccharopolyspora erythraea]|uniref:enoyl-CoA hydratase/isomerase family protein n=1 Tax=Saccharopolyspora erythraea TaxID=1836 RepID=UPI001BA57C0E|nr:enoyl-CoA hydratase/isomerase family protein [Saccharopolyspora erythraea]QUH04160.1 enoyl-CoA hydratase/isomerase family protein [Saccharopolyspora erythraea]